jgi:phospholipid/cholesterol/gamma-HCH transport system permease protein
MESSPLFVEQGTSAPAPASSGTWPGKSFLEEMGELTLFSWQAFRALPGSFRYLSEILRLNALFTRRSTLLIFLMAGFIGVSEANFSFFFLRSIGASDFVGIVPGLITPRQVAPQMFGYAFAGTVCCAISAELGAARIQEEVDAYRAQGIDPMQFLVGSRILAALLFVPLAGAVTLAGNLSFCWFAVVHILQGNQSKQFLDTYFSIFPLANVGYCMITIATLTLQCTLVACFYGMRERSGGPAAVGGSVARGLALNIVLTHLVISLMALIFYGGSLGIPIGD